MRPLVENVLNNVESNNLSSGSVNLEESVIEIGKDFRVIVITLNVAGGVLDWSINTYFNSYIIK